MESWISASAVPVARVLGADLAAPRQAATIRPCTGFNVPRLLTQEKPTRSPASRQRPFHGYPVGLKPANAGVGQQLRTLAGVFSGSAPLPRSASLAAVDGAGGSPSLTQASRAEQHGHPAARRRRQRDRNERACP
jgi:hypothetical protein